jgi:phytoene desaturase
MADYDVVVIGAGCGGLSAGSILARQGRKVLVVEQQDRVGGCCSTFDRDGFKFDVGASVVEVIHPIETAFNELGTSFFDECDLIPVDPIYSYIEPDGNHIDYPVSIEETRKVYEKIDPHDAESWTKMTDYFFDMINKLIKVYAVNPANTPLDMLKMVIKYPGMLKFIPLFFKSYQDVLEKYFKNPIILETMAFQSYYVGLPPELCPGYVALIPYSEHEGIYYPRGGMIKIPQAFQRVGEKYGMEIRMSTLIDKVLVRNRRVEGVRLSDGTEISCKVVVSDTHALNLYFKLIGEEHLPLLPKIGLKSIKPSMGSPMIYLGLDYKPPLTAHHSLTIESMDLMNDYWWNYHLKGKLPSQPFSLICWTSDTDPGMAPEGMHLLQDSGRPGHRLPRRLRGAGLEGPRGLQGGLHPAGYGADAAQPGREHLRHQHGPAQLGDLPAFVQVQGHQGPLPDRRLHPSRRRRAHRDRFRLRGGQAHREVREVRVRRLKDG